MFQLETIFFLFNFDFEDSIFLNLPLGQHDITEIGLVGDYLASCFSLDNIL